MPSSNSPVKVFITDDSPLMRGAGLMPIAGEKQQDSIHGSPVASPNTAVREIQLDGGLDRQVWRVVRSVAPNIDFLVFNNSSDPRYRKCYPGVGAEDFFDKTANLTSWHMLPSKPRSKSPLNP